MANLKVVAKFTIEEEGKKKEVDIKALGFQEVDLSDYKEETSGTLEDVLKQIEVIKVFISLLFRIHPSYKTII